MISVDISCAVTRVQWADACRGGPSPKTLSDHKRHLFNPSSPASVAQRTCGQKASVCVPFPQATNPQIFVEIDKEAGKMVAPGTAAPPPVSGRDRWAVGRVRKQRSWLPQAAGPCLHALYPPSEERPQREDFTWKLWDWCFSTCEVRPAQDGCCVAARMWPVVKSLGGSRGRLEPLADVPLSGGIEREP